jgi:putative ABC transport system ATP-binding protein
VTALTDINFSVEEGEFVAIMGESGSGKTTLLNILASLDVPTSGKVCLAGKVLSELKEKKKVDLNNVNCSRSSYYRTRVLAVDDFLRCL